MGSKHIQLSPPYTSAPTTSNCYRQTRGPQTTPNCHSHTRRHIAHQTIITTLVGTNHIQLPWPHTWAPNTFNCHHNTRGRQPHPTATAKRVDPQLHHNCHSHTRRHKPHPTGITKLVGTNHIQLPWPHTWISNTSNCHSHTRGHQPHPTVTTKPVGTNHIQLRRPHTWAPNTFNCHRHTHRRQPHSTATAKRVGHKPHPTAIATHAGTNHIKLASPNSWVPITSNC